MSDEPKPKGVFPSIEHQFRKGQSGNPAGRPKGTSLDAKLRELLESSELNGIKLADNKVVGDIIVLALVKHAANGDQTLLRYIFDRVCGKTPEMVRVSGGLGLGLSPALAESLARAYGPDPSTDDETTTDSIESENENR